MYNVLEIVERSIQRGGRALSVVDLIEAGTLSLRQAGWLVARIEEGASWMVGAKPGGAGKTTIMSALLAMLPEGEMIRLTNPDTDWRESLPGQCVVSYEISPGYYDAYIWGEDVARFAQLGRAGCRLVTNLHADTLEEARKQIVDDCGADLEGFCSFEMFLPVRERVVSAIHFCEGGVWKEWQEGPVSRREQEVMEFLKGCAEKQLRRVEDVRRAWLDCAFAR